MKAKRYIKRTLKVVCIVLAIVLLMQAATVYVFHLPERDVIRVEAFRSEPKDSLDLVLIGASEVYTFYSACRAYEISGITSYPYSSAGATVGLWKTMLKDTLKHQSPQLIAVEISGACYLKEENLYPQSAAHSLFDLMPLSPAKIELVNEYCAQNTRVGKPIEYFVPIVLYHENWKQTEQNLRGIKDMADFQKRGYALLKGLYSESKSYHDERYHKPLELMTTREEMLPSGKACLIDFLEYCRDNDVNNIVFFRFPHRIGSLDDKNAETLPVANTAGDIIRSYGYDFYNWEDRLDDIGIDTDTDFYNDGHMNLYGSMKFTDYLISFLQDNYGLQAAPRTEKVQKEWEKSLEAFKISCEIFEQNMSNNRYELLYETALFDEEIIKREEIKNKESASTS